MWNKMCSIHNTKHTFIVHANRKKIIQNWTIRFIKCNVFVINECCPISFQ